MLYPFDTLLNTVNRELEKLEMPNQPSGLYEPARYALTLGGKRIRPILTLMACNLFSSEIDKAIAPALGIEIFHNFTLLHDDVMDKAEIRRGKPTVHKVWTANHAILSGDAMQIIAYQLIGKSPADTLPEILSLFSKTALEICEGQQYDMDFEQRDDVTEAEYLEMIRLKTAVLLGCALKTGALVAGASATNCDLIYRFGEKIGLAFQLKDDLLDTFGNEAVFGKAIGGDIACNKKTFLWIHAMQKANDQQKAELQKWVSLKEFDRAEKVKAVKNIYGEIGVKEICEKKMDTYFGEAMDALSAMEVNVLQKSELTHLADQLMKREV